MGSECPIHDEAGEILTANLKWISAFEADDQSTLVYWLISQKDKWRNIVLFEISYYLHGFCHGLGNRYEEMIAKHQLGLGDKRWPFVT